MAFDLDSLANEAREIFRPLADAFRDAAALAALLERLGYARSPDALGAVVADLSAVVAQIDALTDASDDTDESKQLERAVEALAAVARLAAALPDAIQKLGAIGIGADLLEELLSLLLIARLDRAHPVLLRVLVLLGVVRQRQTVAGQPSGRDLDYGALSVDWPSLASAFTEPGGLMKRVYGWGTPDFDAQCLIWRLSRALEELGVQARTDRPSGPLKQALALGASESPPWFSAIDLIVQDSSDGDARFGIAILPAAGATAADRGIAFMPLVEGQLAATIPLAEGLDVVIEGGGALAGGLVAIVRPSGLTLNAGVLDGNAGASAAGSIALRWSPSSEITLLGDADRTRLVTKGGLVRLLLGAGDVSVELAATEAAIVVQAGDGDGFLRDVLPPDPIRIPFQFGVGFSHQRGLYFSGGAGLQLTLQLDLALGPLTISALELELNADGGGLHVDCGVRAGLQIGPVAAVVDGIGMTSAIDFGTHGALGVGDVKLGFKPPKGIGISVDATVVRGGGYIFFDPDRHQYAGVGSLAIHAGIDLTIDIVVLVTTDDHAVAPAPSYSLLVLASVEFSPGIALFGGFFLGGLGLLVGINRAIDPEALRSGVKSGLLASLLFPENPLADAPKLVSDLDHAFPRAAGCYVLGALAKISYGTGPAEIFTAELGLAVQLGGAFVLTVIGQFSLVWPRKPGAEVLVLHLDCCGLWDSASKQFSIDASLIDSHVLGWQLTGDAAFRAGGTSGFLLSVGGFHPHFQAPAAFPKLDRLAIGLSAGPARLRLEAYTAITSNTFQMGAHADAVIDLKVCSVEGHLAFDALLQFDPFHFEIDIDASLAIKVAGMTLLGVQVALHVSGPNPWHVAGQLAVEIIGFKIRVGFDKTFGDERPAESLPLADALKMLTGALQQPRAWSATLPDALASLIALAPPAGSGAVRAHPLARLAVQQREVPLDVEIDRVGATRVAQRQSLAITGATIGGQAAAIEKVQDLFAAAQFVDMSDDDKLARPSFEPMDAGVRLSPGAAPPNNPVAAPIGYLTFVVDDVGATPDGAPHPISAEVAAALAVHGSTAAPPTGKPAPAVAVGARQFVVASRDDLSRVGDDAPAGYTRAHQAARRLAAAQPAQRGRLQIVGAHEVAA